ncbi:MAG TPA: hypothetical protein VHB79_35460 [Polyangiaceae bacterium]|nr:hypothetical protein [Polyangiaceae bacterium]
MRCLVPTCVAVLTACSSKPLPVSDNLVGAHGLDGTYITTSLHDPSGSPSGLQPQSRIQLTFEAAREGDDQVRVSWVKNGTSFLAQIHGGVVEAKDARATVSPMGAASRGDGVTSLVVRHFRWETDTGNYQEVDETVTNVPGGGLDYAFIDGRVVGIKDTARKWLHYHAATNYPSDFAQGDACVERGSATTDGFLGLDYGANHDQLRVYWQGIGCTISAQRGAGSNFEADGADCPLDPTMSIAALGFTSWKLDQLALDLAAKKLSFVARGTRKRDDGKLVDLCLKLDSDVTGEFPE